ncbi:hypothetical protein [Opitutus terrae]|uniref:DUF5666 domain-containing protein n=1 Tax=Opitutus terrae (strain DSM 11246 / JCM 15787 / PB90-1) TaxID=452637 RepID=B1ZTK7_OPITP|nr:hypothetical protein [Opitutus terrae]ACB73952.1 hypothetical protein Oter_0663 [Opitutus terrae PB90-1]
MKRSFVLAFGLAITTSWLHAEVSSDYVVEAKSASETFTSKVLKVYSFSAENIDYVAYVVNWRGHEIVVTPGFMPAGKALGVGDPIRCTMHHFSRPSGLARVAFTMAPSVGEAPGLLPDPAHEQTRLDAIAAEVERRRAIRQEALNAVQSARPGRSAAEPKSAP